jgi:hypothetical protein|tara:strand:+ start:2165 stop:3049 length:885 start_codon:yes stop_codon:yes gene_type:complete
MQTKVSHDDFLTFYGHGDTWKIDIKSSPRVAGSYYDEAIKAARIIYEESDNDVHVMFGGGNDCEYMVNVFRKADIPFKVAIISYGKNFKYNAHDTKYARDWCVKYKYDPIIIDLDIEDFVKSGRMLDVAEESMCCEYRMTSTMEGASKVDGTVVMANEPQVCSMGDGTWAWEEYERINSYGNWWESRGIKGTSDFGSYTGEQVLAFLEEPIIKRLVNNEMVEYKSSIPVKQILYNQNSWHQRQRWKYTGWERFERTELFDTLNVSSQMLELKQKYNGSFYLDYDETVKQLRGIE